MEDVLRKIRIEVRKGAAHIVALSAPRGCELLEERHDAVIAAFPAVIDAEPVVHFLSAVETEDHIVALSIRPFYNFVSDADAVRRKRKAEVLVLLFFNAPGIRDELFAHLEVHERFPAEEVHFQVLPEARVLHQEIKGSFSRLEAHKAR